MTIDELRKMKKREYALWFSNAKTTDLKEVLNNANLGGGISKFTKAMLIEAVMDLVDGIETELTSKLKPKRATKKRISKDIDNKQETNKEKTEGETDEWEECFAEADKKHKEQMNKFYNDCRARNLCEEEIMYEEMMLPENKQNLYIFIDLDRANEYTQSGYFTYMGNPEKAKKAYYKLSNYFHPDKPTGDTEKFKNISLAWQMYKTVILKTK